jgi:hypothetical protein
MNTNSESLKIPPPYQTVLIAGAGELGSRYLQSLVSSQNPLEIHLLSHHAESLEKCMSRWGEVGGNGTLHNVSCHLEMGALPSAFDLVVVSSTAEARPELVESIAAQSRVSYWVLEKVIAQNVSGLDRVRAATVGSKGAWVNYYMSSQDLFKAVKQRLAPSHVKHMRVFGGDWGLACNAMHFVHLHAWFNTSQIQALQEIGLADDWHEAKRTGNWEIHGSLNATCQNGGRLSLTAQAGPNGYRLLIIDGNREWEILEAEGLARCSDGAEIICPVEYQSGRPLLIDILQTGICCLPTLEEVLPIDSQFIELMLGAWRGRGNPDAVRVPIT